MFTFEVDGKQCEASATFYTAHLYEMEFQSDLIKDLFGVQTDGENLIEVERTGDGPEDYRIVKVDFTKVSWSTVMKALWATVKTADKSAPGFSDWLRKTSGVNLWVVQDALRDELSECFFRPETAGAQAGEEQRQ